MVERRRVRKEGDKEEEMRRKRERKEGGNEEGERDNGRK